MSILSISDLIDKLVIENIKIFNLREKLHSGTLIEKEMVAFSEKMMLLNENRGVIADALDEKVEEVVSQKDLNRTLKKFKTYNMDRGDEGKIEREKIK